MKKIIFPILLSFCATFPALAGKVNPEVFTRLDLNRPGLEKVKKFHAKGQDEAAAKALLQYYRNRQGVKHPEVNLEKVTISKTEQKWADEALEHKFFAHKGYQPSYFYGKDINWQYWPVKDNELRWQLHRQKWFIPFGKAYRISGDEKYAQAWVEQYMDWVKKNPMPGSQIDYEDPGREDAYQNMRYSWRPLEVSTRLQDQPAEFLYFLNSPAFTPEFLAGFLANYYKHANHIMHNFSKQGNHLLFEAQRMIYAGTFFPEFKDAENWRKKGIEILNREIGKQVYDDGMQYELDLGYHEAAINIFFKALNMAKANGFANEFPPAYLEIIEKMIDVVVNTTFPDYSHPLFSDAKESNKSEAVKNFKKWSKVYPQNTGLQYMASEGKKGSAPTHLSKAYKTSGFYVLRNGWNKESTMMVVKAGPPAFWHNQPDNGTFELYVNGRNFFTDSGCYLYAGEGEVMKQRNWFRQTRVHNTLTLDNRNLETTDSKCLLFDTQEANDILVYENPSYEGLTHRRSVFFVGREFFVIADEATGNATGTVNLHYNLGEGPVKLLAGQAGANTEFTDGNNMMIRTFSDTPMKMAEEEGWVSYRYNERVKRTAYSLNVEKDDTKPTRFITVILPTADAAKAPEVKARFVNPETNEKGLDIEIQVGAKKFRLNYTLEADNGSGK